MTQATPTIGANKSGLQYRTEDNDGKKALLNHHKGSAAPGYAEAGLIWLDDTATPWILKIYDGADWIALGEVHATSNTFKPYSGTAQTVIDLTETSIASAATTDLGTLSSNMALVSGTTTITSLGSSASASRPIYFIRFSAALTLTYNATALILPTAANITTVAGDTAIFEYLGSGNWKCLGYDRLSGASLTLGVEGTIASAATTDLGSAGVNILSISGTTTITSFGSTAIAANPLYFTRFTGALTLTHNATSLIIPGAANLVTTAGDTAMLLYLGSGNWRVLSYMRSNGQTPSMTGADTAIASASTANLGTAGSNVVNITGTTTITGLGSTAAAANPVYFCRFTGALTLTHNATSLILPGAANITTAAGDAAVFKYEGSGNWRCMNYTKADGTAVVGTSLSQASTTEIANESAVAKYISPDRLSSSKRVAQSWTNFDASSGTPTNVSSFNVSSFTDNGTGDTTVNFTNALRDANYVVAGISTSAASTAMSAKVISASTGGAPTTKTTTACRVGTGTSTATDAVGSYFIFM
jgi:hypothetical protein